MVATLWDDLDEAEHAVEDALHLGTDTGQPDAFAVYAGQLVVLRRMQGRSVEICDLAGEVAAANSGLPAFRGAHASLLADAGRVDEATVILDDLCTSGLDRIDVDQLWGALMSWLAQAAGIAGHRPTAEQVARLIAPFHAQRPYTGVALSGSFALALGICNRVLEDYDEADVTFREADAMSEQLAAPYWIALTKLEWGAMLQARDGDTDDAIGLLTTAAAIADRRGYRSLKTRADAARPS